MKNLNEEVTRLEALVAELERRASPLWQRYKEAEDISKAASKEWLPVHEAMREAQAKLKLVKEMLGEGVK